MIKLTDDMHRFLDNPPGHLNPCIIATADLHGTPNAGFIGTVFAISDDTLCYRDRSGKNPLDHIESNPCSEYQGRIQVGNFCVHRKYIAKAHNTTPV